MKAKMFRAKLEASRYACSSMKKTTIVYTDVREQLLTEGWQEVAKDTVARTWNLAEVASEGNYRRYENHGFYLNPLYVRYVLDFSRQSASEYAGTADQELMNRHFRADTLSECYLFLEKDNDSSLSKVEPLRYRVQVSDNSYFPYALVQVTHSFKSVTFSAEAGDYLLRSPAGHSHNTFFRLTEEAAQKIVSGDETVANACRSKENARRQSYYKRLHQQRMQSRSANHTGKFTFGKRSKLG